MHFDFLTRYSRVLQFAHFEILTIWGSVLHFAHFVHFEFSDKLRQGLAICPLCTFWDFWQVGAGSCSLHILHILCIWQFEAGFCCIQGTSMWATCVLCQNDKRPYNLRNLQILSKRFRVLQFAQFVHFVKLIEGTSICSTCKVCEKDIWSAPRLSALFNFMQTNPKPVCEYMI